MKKIFMIGGTGLLGSVAAEKFIERGDKVVTLSLPAPEGAKLPEEMEVHHGSYLDLSDEEIAEFMSDADYFVFAAGVDERVEFPPPVYDSYAKYNIDPLKRLLSIAKENGVETSIIFGSYFSYFAKSYPEMKLYEKHPYIRSRIDQEELAFSFADDKMGVGVLELPYIFGTQEGRQPVWTILIEQIQGMGPITMFPRGGTTMVTVDQVAQATVGAADKTKGAVAWPIGYYNKTWNEFLTIVHTGMGMPDRKIVNVPKWTFQAFGIFMRRDYKKRGVEGGIDPVGLADVMCMNTFIDKKWCVELGVQEDDIETAIYDSVKLSVAALDGTTSLVQMSGE